MFKPPSKKFLEDLKKIQAKGPAKDPNSIEERFKKKLPNSETPTQLTEGALNAGTYKPYEYGGKVYNTIRFNSPHEANDFLEANPDHGVLDEEPTGVIHVAHNHDSGRPKSGIVAQSVYEDVNPIVRELTIFMENAPELHSLSENIQIRKTTPDVPYFSIHLKALLEKERPNTLWLQFGQNVADEYERRYGYRASMSEIHEAVSHWMKHPIRAFKANQRSGGKDTALTGDMDRNMPGRSMVNTTRHLGNAVSSLKSMPDTIARLHKSIEALGAASDKLNKQLSTPEGKARFREGLRRRKGLPPKPVQEDRKIKDDDDWTNQYTRKDQDRVYHSAGRIEDWLHKRGHKRAMVSVSHGVEELPHGMGAKRTMGVIVQPDYKNKHEINISAKPSVERDKGYQKAMGKRMLAVNKRLARLSKDKDTE